MRIFRTVFGIFFDISKLTDKKYNIVGGGGLDVKRRLFYHYSLIKAFSQVNVLQLIRKRGFGFVETWVLIYHGGSGSGFEWVRSR
jgi:hypothetical protein